MTSNPGRELGPRNVGNYRITRLLGEGGMGSVYLGVHPDIKSEVAIKILHPHLVTDAEMVRRFIDEARAVNQVKHPGIVRIHDCAEQQGVGLYLVMEFLEGRDLAEYAREHGPLETQSVVRIIRQVASALASVHKEGIVHRDLKSSNIMLVSDPDVTGGERAKVLDFGIAKLWESTSKSRLETDPCLVMGSVGYMSPEQCLDFRTVDHRTDIYSLGAIAYELLCGRTPYPARTTSELARQHRAARSEGPSSRIPGVSPELDAVVMKALSVEPSRRYQSMNAFGDALQAAMTGSRGEGDESDAGSKTTDEVRTPAWLSRRNKTILLVVALGVVVVDVVLFLAILRDPDRTRMAPAERPAVTARPVADPRTEPDSGLARDTMIHDLTGETRPPDRLKRRTSASSARGSRRRRRARRSWRKRRRRRATTPAGSTKKRAPVKGKKVLPYDDL